MQSHIIFNKLCINVPDMSAGVQMRFKVPRFAHDCGQAGAQLEIGAP
jgi:hypothetical protein